MIDLKRIIIIFIVIVLVIGTITIICKLIKKDKTVQTVEYVPEEEISEEQIRKTIISLFFKSGDNLVPEARSIDAKELLSNPYETILNLLIAGPKNTNLKATIPVETKIIGIKKEKDILILDLSKDFIEKHVGGEKEEKITIESILNTLTQFTEINGIKILINGEENKSFLDGIIKFDKIFKNKIN